MSVLGTKLSISTNLRLIEAENRVGAEARPHALLHTFMTDETQPAWAIKLHDGAWLAVQRGPA
jgi:hypothetical protein